MFKKTYIRVPPVMRRGFLDKGVRALVGAPLSAYYRHRARKLGQPGLEFASQSASIAIRALFSDRSLSLTELYEMAVWPIESTRYFEFDAAWRFFCDFPVRRYLDVSSPRLFPLLLTLRRSEVTADLLNPDTSDLDKTSALVKTCGLASRCQLSGCPIEQARFEAGSFDAISSLSVMEHIPDSSHAARQIWEWLKPGGKLVLSVPCAAAAEQQYIDVDHYGLQKPNVDGFFFHQYLYDEPLLEEHFFTTFGRPRRQAIFGEKENGALQRGLMRKWAQDRYPRWKEPYLMAQQFQGYSSLADLPGEGVIIMEFVKT